MRYRRANTPGATYFFTLNAANRSGCLLTEHIGALRDSFAQYVSHAPSCWTPSACCPITCTC
jgi:putative transposase